MPSILGSSDMDGEYFDGRTARAVPVACRVAPPALYIDRGAAGTLIWPVMDLFLAAPPAPGVPLTLGSVTARNERLAVHSQMLANALAAASPALRKALRRFQPWTAKQWLAGCAAALASLGIAAMALRAAPSLIVPLVPYSWEMALGNRIAHYAPGHSGACQSTAADAALRKLAQRLATAAGWDRPLDIRLVNFSVNNAVATPGGHIIIFNGLVQEARSGDELAGVFAHELGHVVYRHALQRVLRQLGLNALLTMATGGATGDVNTAVANYGATLYQLSYNRDAERDADAFALAILKKAGLRSDGLATFFAHLDEKGKLEIPPWLSTHPATPERIEAAKAGGGGGDAAFTAEEWEAIKLACGASRRASPTGLPSSQRKN